MFRRKQYISLFFLVFFVFFKATGLHALSHSENDFNFNDCELCEFVTSNDIPLNTNSKVVLDPIIFKNYNSQPTVYYSYLFTQKQVDKALFCRPPPTL